MAFIVRSIGLAITKGFNSSEGFGNIGAYKAFYTTVGGSGNTAYNTIIATTFKASNRSASKASSSSSIALSRGSITTLYISASYS